MECDIAIDKGFDCAPSPPMPSLSFFLLLYKC